MGKAWVKSRKRDQFYREAKAQGYRSRAAFKLIQIDARYDLIYEGDAVIDLGAAPGGWAQVARELVGDHGRVVAVDRVGIRAIEGVEASRGDVADQEFLDAFVAAVGKVDVVISDMSPRLSGTKSLDHARSVELSQRALGIAFRVLKPHGSFVCKVFQGDLFESFREEVTRRFKTVAAYTPEASRKESREIYIVGKGFRA